MVVSLSSLTSFNEEEKIVYLIFQRKKLRILYNNCCQKIISINFKILKLRRSLGDLNLVKSLEFANYYKELDKESKNKIVLKTKIDDMVIYSQMDKLADIENNFKKNLSSINNNLKAMNETNQKIKKMKKVQNSLIENIDDCLKLITN